MKLHRGLAGTVQYLVVREELQVSPRGQPRQATVPWAPRAGGGGQPRILPILESWLGQPARLEA